MEEQPRAAAQSRGFVLVEGDIEFLKLAYEFRLVRIDNLVLLTGRTYKKIHGRVFKLVEHGYLKPIKLPLQKHIYAIGSKAVPVLVEQGSASAELALQRLRTHELKELFVKHELMVVDIHTMLRAAATETIQLVAWKEGVELFDRVDVGDRGRVRTLPIRPDAFFTLEDAERPAGENRISFFLEADRSTTTHGRFEEKLVAYWQYLRHGRHTEKYGIRTFRVLTVALTPARARNLCALAAKVLPPEAHKFFLFGSAGQGRFSLAAPAGILGAVFSTPRDPLGREPLPLVPRRREALASSEIRGSI